MKRLGRYSKIAIFAFLLSGCVHRAEPKAPLYDRLTWKASILEPTSDCPKGKCERLLLFVNNGGKVDDAILEICKKRGYICTAPYSLGTAYDLTRWNRR